MFPRGDLENLFSSCGYIWIDCVIVLLWSLIFMLWTCRKHIVQLITDFVCDLWLNKVVFCSFLLVFFFFPAASERDIDYSIQVVCRKPRVWAERASTLSRAVLESREKLFVGYYIEVGCFVSESIFSFIYLFIFKNTCGLWLNNMYLQKKNLKKFHLTGPWTLALSNAKLKAILTPGSCHSSFLCCTSVYVQW